MFLHFIETLTNDIVDFEDVGRCDNLKHSRQIGSDN